MHDHHNDHPHPDTPASTVQPRPAARRWLKRSLYCLLALLLLLAAVIAWLAGTESGLRTLLRLPALAGVNIRAEKLQGTLWHGFQAEKLHIDSGGSRLDIASLVLEWDAARLRQRHLHIRRLAVGDVHLDSRARPPKEEGPAATLPQNIDLPLAVSLDEMSIGAVTTGADKQVLLLPSQAAYVYDRQQHRLQLASLRTPWHNIQGDIRLHTTPPFALDGALSGKGLLDDQPVQSHARLSGSLALPVLQAEMQGGEVYLQTDAKLKPFALQLNHKIISLNLLGRRLNPQAFLPSLPKADVDFSIGMAPSIVRKNELDGVIGFSNAQPGAVDAGGLPLRLMSGALNVDGNGLIRIRRLEADLMQSGRLRLGGQIDSAAGHMDVNTVLTGIHSGDVLARALPGRLDGHIRVHGAFDNLQTEWQLATDKALSEGSMQMLTDRDSRQQTLLLEKLQLRPKDGGLLQAKGSLALFQEQALQLHIDSDQLNPNKLNNAFPAGHLNGHIEVKGHLAGEPELRALMQWRNSSLSGAPLSGKGDIHWQQSRLARADVQLQLGRNRFVSQGSFGGRGDSLKLDIQAPELALFGFGLNGLLNAQGQLAGSWQRPSLDLRGQARNLAVAQALKAGQLDFTLQGSPDIEAPLNIQLQGQALHAGGQRIDRVQANIGGRGKQHSLRADAQMQLDGKPYRLDVAANGGFDAQYQWRGRVATLDIGGAFNLKLLAPLQLEAGSEKVAMNQARWALMGGSLELNSLLWERQRGLSTRGRAHNLALRELHNIMPLPLEQNLVLGGDWDLSYSDNARGYLNIRQQAGDITLPYRKQALGLNGVVLETRFQQGRIDNRLSGQTRYGDVDARVTIAQRFGNDILQAPVSGRIKIDAPDLSRTKHLLPVGMSLSGSLAADAALSGTVGTPQLNGSLNGENLYYRERGNGVVLENGSLRSRFQGRRWLIDALRFQRKDGQVTLKGAVNLVGNTPDVDVSAHFERYAILDQINRRLTLSGQAQLLYSVSRGVVLAGQLRVDHGHFGFPKSGMPTLDDDVVVLGRPRPEPGAPLAINLNLALDLNDRFRFSGEGLDVLLGGQLVATAERAENIQVVGTVNIVRGQYKAYGQDLVIQQGSISFVGPIDNPNLKLRATRRFSPVEAGVEVLGNLNNPRVSLTANQPMSDKDKLSWLILGRASSGSSGDEAALNAALGAWLAGGINDRLQLVDEFGFTSQQTRNLQTGELNPAEQVITVGKRLTNDLHLGYQYGIDSATQTVKLTYQINRALQAIANFGTRSVGGEIRYTIRFD